MRYYNFKVRRHFNSCFGCGKTVPLQFFQDVLSSSHVKTVSGELYIGLNFTLFYNDVVNCSCMAYRLFRKTMLKSV